MRTSSLKSIKLVLLLLPSHFVIAGCLAMPFSMLPCLVVSLCCSVLHLRLPICATLFVLFHHPSRLLPGEPRNHQRTHTHTHNPNHTHACMVCLEVLSAAGFCGAVMHRDDICFFTALPPGSSVFSLLLFLLFRRRFPVGTVIISRCSVSPFCETFNLICARHAGTQQITH